MATIEKITERDSELFGPSARSSASKVQIKQNANSKGFKPVPEVSSIHDLANNHRKF